MEKLSFPDLSSIIKISPQQQEEFQQNGHILLKGVVDADDIELYQHLIHNCVEKLNTEFRDLSERDTYGKAFLQIMNLWETDVDIKGFTFSKRFAQIAADLMGVEKVRLYHDQALFKEAGGGPTPWHQDQYYWPIDTANTVTMWMPLIDISEEMGMLTFASGSHRLGFLGNLSISDESENVLGGLVKEKGFSIERPSSMRAGDATFHAGWTLHNAPGNNSIFTREVMTIIYVADGARISQPKNSHQESDRKRWLGGLSEGAFITSDLNPIVN